VLCPERERLGDLAVHEHLDEEVAKAPRPLCQGSFAKHFIELVVSFNESALLGGATPRVVFCRLQAVRSHVIVHVRRVQE
jgi:hypothetical protein